MCRICFNTVASVYRRAADRLKSLWYLCPIFMILTPTRHRPRAQKYEYVNTQPSEALGAQAREFWRQLRDSFLCLFSPTVWTNAPFLIYVLANGLAAAGVVIPWTFVYDYVRTQWVTGLDSASDFSLSLPAFMMTLLNAFLDVFSVCFWQYVPWYRTALSFCYLSVI